MMGKLKGRGRASGTGGPGHMLRARARVGKGPCSPVLQCFRRKVHVTRCLLQMLKTKVGA